VKDIVEKFLEYQMDELPDDEINPALFLIYFEENLILE